VRRPFPQGAVVVQSEDGSFTRLSWDEPDGPETLPLAAGKYRMRSYQVVREDDRGATWFLVASAPSLGEFEAEAGETVSLPLDPRPRFALSASWRGPKLMAGVTLTGRQPADESPYGITLYREGRRIDLACALLDREGRELARRDLRYG
jgi:hypothetical protein